MQPLTNRQHEIYEFIGRVIRTSGIAPSLEEISTAMGLRSLATVHKHLLELEAKKWISRRWNARRSITLLVGYGCCPTCGRELEKKSVDEAKAPIDFRRKMEDDKAVEAGTPIPTPT